MGEGAQFRHERQLAAGTDIGMRRHDLFQQRRARSRHPHDEHGLRDVGAQRGGGQGGGPGALLREPPLHHVAVIGAGQPRLARHDIAPRCLMPARAVAQPPAQQQRGAAGIVGQPVEPRQSVAPARADRQHARPQQGDVAPRRDGDPFGMGKGRLGRGGIARLLGRLGRERRGIKRRGCRRQRLARQRGGLLRFAQPQQRAAQRRRQLRRLRRGQVAPRGAQVPRTFHQRLALDHPLADEGVRGRGVGGERDGVARHRLCFIGAAVAQQEMRQIVARPQRIGGDRHQMAQPAFGARAIAARLRGDGGDFQQVGIVRAGRQQPFGIARRRGVLPGVERMAQRIDRGRGRHRVSA